MHHKETFFTFGKPKLNPRFDERETKYYFEFRTKNENLVWLLGYAEDSKAYKERGREKVVDEN